MLQLGFRPGYAAVTESPSCDSGDKFEAESAAAKAEVGRAKRSVPTFSLSWWAGREDAPLPTLQ